MKKILLFLITISIALIGLSFVSAADVNSHSSDLPIFHGVQPIVKETQPIVQGMDVIGLNTDLPILHIGSTLKWTHHERNPRG